MNSYEEELEQKKSKVLVENNAQTIFDRLTELSNLGGFHERRWLWELLQNAKDSVEEGHTVSIEVELSDRELAFKHNGNPFSEDEVIHLIYHGSTKKYDLGKTGKFGTGFITTHLLSRKVVVLGTLDGGRKFKFTLDRSGESPKEIENAMEFSWKEFKKLTSDIDDNNFTTIYQYNLDEESKNIAQKGIQDLSKLLPLVLAFNPKIHQFSVKTDQVQKTFRRVNRNIPNQTRIKIVTIEISEDIAQNSLHIIAIATEDKTAVAIPLNGFETNYSIRKIESDVPKLFYDFPLFGTEDFAFPAIINSSEFVPKAERDGIYLGEKDNDNINTNKRIIQIACDLFSELTNYACSCKWNDLYLLAYFHPPTKKDWLDFEWYKKILQNLQQNIETKTIVWTELGEYISPMNALFPNDDPNEELWELAKPFFAEKLPPKTNIYFWLDILKSWENLDINISKYSLTFKNLCTAISEKQTLNELACIFQSDIEYTIDWLNKFYCQLIHPSRRSLLEDFALIPNQNKALVKKTTSLYLDEGIDDSLKDIAKSIGKDWREQLVLTGISVDKSLFAGMNQENILTNTLQELKRKSHQSTQNSPLLNPIIDTFAWLVQNQKTDLLKDFPLATKTSDKDTDRPFAFLSSDKRFLAPVELWKKVSPEFAELFPPEYILSSEYCGRLSDENWSFLFKENFILSEPLYEEETELEYQMIFHEESEQKDHKLQSIQCSRVAFLDQPKDKSIIDRIRNSNTKAILFIKFILSCVIERDNKWMQPINVHCECGTSHQIIPSHWFHYINYRKWVPSSNRGSQALTAQSIASLLEKEKPILSKIMEDRPSLFLNKLDISAGEILRNIVTGNNENMKLVWDKVFCAMLASETDPNNLLKEFQEREQNRKMVLANQELGKKIEDIFAATFSSDEIKRLGFKVERTGVGSDFEVEHDFIDKDKEILLDLKSSNSSTLVEIKSTAKPFCSMTSTQAIMAIENSEKFCLCVVPLDKIEITEDIIRDHARFVTNIGDLLKPKVEQAFSIQKLHNEAAAKTDDIEIDISAPQVKYRINRTVWQNAKTFEEFVSLFLESQHQ